jgi:hypothetical protein
MVAVAWRERPDWRDWEMGILYKSDKSLKSVEARDVSRLLQGIVKIKKTEVDSSIKELR